MPDTTETGDTPRNAQIVALLKSAQNYERMAGEMRGFAATCRTQAQILALGGDHVEMPP